MRPEDIKTSFDYWRRARSLIGGPLNHRPYLIEIAHPHKAHGGRLHNGAEGRFILRVYI